MFGIDIVTEDGWKEAEYRLQQPKNSELRQWVIKSNKNAWKFSDFLESLACHMLRPGSSVIEFFPRSVTVVGCVFQKINVNKNSLNKPAILNYSVVVVFHLFLQQALFSLFRAPSLIPPQRSLCDTKNQSFEVYTQPKLVHVNAQLPWKRGAK